MTTIFAFPITSGWILASDKLETEQTEAQRIQTGFETNPSGARTKIKQIGSFVYAMSGSSWDILKIEQALSSCINETIDYCSFKAAVEGIYGAELPKLDVEAILIDTRKLKAYKLGFSKLESSLQKTEIFQIEDGLIGSGSSHSRGKYHIISCLSSYQDMKVKENDPVSIRLLLGKSVECLEIMGRTDSQFTGHPAVYGCDICIFTQSKIMKFKIIPRRYKCKEETQTDWLPIEEWKND